MDTRLEITVAGKHRGADIILGFDHSFDLRIQRAGVADTGHAAIAHRIESQLIQIVLKPGAAQIFTDDTRTRSQRGLDVSGDFHSQLNSFLCHESRGQQQSGIRRVGTAGDTRDQDAAVADLDFLAVCQSDFRGRFLLRERCGKFLLLFRQFDLILRTFRTGDAGFHRAEIQLHDFGIIYLSFARDAEHSLCLVVGFIETDHFFGTPCQSKEFDAFLIHGEESHRGTVFRRHIGDHGAFRHGQRGGSFAEVFHEFTDHFGLAQ